MRDALFKATVRGRGSPGRGVDPLPPPLPPPARARPGSGTDGAGGRGPSPPPQTGGLFALTLASGAWLGASSFGFANHVTEKYKDKGEGRPEPAAPPAPAAEPAAPAGRLAQVKAFLRFGGSPETA